MLILKVCTSNIHFSHLTVTLINGKVRLSIISPIIIYVCSLIPIHNSSFITSAEMLSGPSPPPSLYSNLAKIQVLNNYYWCPDATLPLPPYTHTTFVFPWTSLHFDPKAQRQSSAVTCQGRCMILWPLQRQHPGLLPWLPSPWLCYNGNSHDNSFAEQI